MLHPATLFEARGFQAEARHPVRPFALCRRKQVEWVAAITGGPAAAYVGFTQIEDALAWAKSAILKYTPTTPPLQPPVPDVTPRAVILADVPTLVRERELLWETERQKAREVTEATRQRAELLELRQQEERRELAERLRESEQARVEAEQKRRQAERLRIHQQELDAAAQARRQRVLARAQQAGVFDPLPANVPILGRREAAIRSITGRPIGHPDADGVRWLGTTPPSAES